MPFVVLLDLCGAASIQILDRTEVRATDPDLYIDAFLRDGILDSFVVSDNANAGGVGFKVDVAPATHDAFVSSFATQFSVALADTSDGAMTIVDRASLKTVAEYLMGVASTYILGKYTSSFVDRVSANALNSLSLSDMGANYNMAADETFRVVMAGSPGLRATLASSIPAEIWAKSWSSNALPLKNGGDTLQFEFKISQNYNVAENHISVTPASNSSFEIASAGGDSIDSSSFGRVPAKSVVLVLRRPAPADYVSWRDGAKTPYSASNQPVQDASSNVDTARNQYVTDKTASDAADAAYNAGYAVHDARVIADQDVTNATRLYNVAVADLAAKSQKVSDREAFSLANGIPLATDNIYIGYVSDQTKAVTKVTSADADKTQRMTAAAAAAAADLAPINADAEAALAILLSTATSTDVTAKASLTAWEQSQAALIAANAQYKRDLELQAYETEKKNALQESANSAAANALYQWTSANTNANTLKTNLTTVDQAAVDQAWGEQLQAAADLEAFRASNPNDDLTLYSNNSVNKNIVYSGKLDIYNHHKEAATSAATKANGLIAAYTTLVAYSDSYGSPSSTSSIDLATIPSWSYNSANYDATKYVQNTSAPVTIA